MNYDISTKGKITAAKEEAKQQFFQQRVENISSVYFPAEKYHPEFKTYLQKLLLSNNMKQMGVLIYTWHNMCHFDREFFMPEMEICLEVLLRATPNELGCKFSELCVENRHLSKNERILQQYNTFEYNKILEIVKSMRITYDNIDFQISKPIADKINAHFKLKLQIPIGTDIKFVVPNSTAVQDGK